MINSFDIPIKRRLEIYKIALEKYSKPTTQKTYPYILSGLCNCIKIITNSNVIYDHMEKSYPELWIQKPKLYRSISSLWFPEGCKAPRKRILINAIKLTKDSLTKLHSTTLNPFDKTKNS